METQFLLANIFTGVNLLLVAALFAVYLRMCLKTGSLFTLGLLIFAGMFLLQNAVSFYFFITMMPYFVPEVANYVLILTVLQTIAFAILNWITWK